jgi:hypothetical protein
MSTVLTPSLVHGVIKLCDTNTIIDYFQTSVPYDVLVHQWEIINPLQSIGEYYERQARSTKNLPAAEQSVIYNKYHVGCFVYFMSIYADSPQLNHAEIIKCGEFILNSIDIPKIMASKDIEIDRIKSNLSFILSIMIENYSVTRNRTGFNNAERLLNQYYRDDPAVKPFLDYYRF